MSTVDPAEYVNTVRDGGRKCVLSLPDMEWWLAELAGLVLEVCPSCNREQLEPSQLVCRWCWWR